ncbi:hypothetical protein N7520_007442 [Penicillium odoratum]|uniref:uncharacterized protein n=1 Tax=Penicillium odoratum TaxID=1167516 RepID=UPI0025465C46|nr:uncharacterized protein N7520_007442 [Penicillium odoratum]KAJ5760286.1 hypothetical protein N7520_007442 [Penicillium odoratum]
MSIELNNQNQKTLQDGKLPASRRKALKMPQEPIPLQKEYHTRVFQVKLSPQAAFYKVKAKLGDGVDEWEGIIGPGMMFIEAIARTEDTNLPYSSQLAKAAYDECYDPEGLKCVFVENIQNDETMEFMRDSIYPEWNKVDFEAPRKSFDRLFWARGLRGTRRVAKIVNWMKDSRFHLRFDIQAL